MTQTIDLRPEILDDALVPDAIRELFTHTAFLAGMHQFLPPPVTEMILREKDEVRTIADFQAKIAYPLFKLIEQTSITSLTTSGLEHLDPEKRYLFLSNHRDIVLDSAFLNTSLFDRGIRTSQIAIGDNLMKHRLSELIFKMNKSFVVKRTGSPMELYRYSVQMSDHIHRQITEGIDSVWIAQREGRAKDGNDRTQTGLLKMLSLSAKGDLVAFFKSLNIVPVSISYEFLPCDVLQAQEMLNKRQNPEYKKTFEEDLQHMLQGLKGTKGRVHLHFDTSFSASLDNLNAFENTKQQLEELAGMIDRSIQSHYELHEINSVAQYFLENNAFPEPPDPTTREAIAYFEKRRTMLQRDSDGDGYRYLLGVYANPLRNKSLLLQNFFHS